MMIFLNRSHFLCGINKQQIIGGFMVRGENVKENKIQFHILYNKSIMA